MGGRLAPSIVKILVIGCLCGECNFHVNLYSKVLYVSKYILHTEKVEPLRANFLGLPKLPFKITCVIATKSLRDATIRRYTFR